MEPLIQMNKFEVIDMPGMTTLAFVVEKNEEEYKKGNALLSLQKIECIDTQIDGKIKNHPKLKDTTLIEKKKKIYSLIAWISLCLPILICGSIALYCLITENSVKGNMWWGIFFIAIPLIS